MVIPVYLVVSKPEFIIDPPELYHLMNNVRQRVSDRESTCHATISD